MVASFITAGFIAGLIIALFSFVGIYGNLIGVVSTNWSWMTVSGGRSSSCCAGYQSCTLFYNCPAYVVIICIQPVFNVERYLDHQISVVDSTFSSTARLIGLQAMGYISHVLLNLNHSQVCRDVY